MTSEQQIRSKFGKDNIYAYSVGRWSSQTKRQLPTIHVIKVYISEDWYCIGIGKSRYKAFTDALIKTGGKRIFGSGKYQKNKL